MTPVAHTPFAFDTEFDETGVVVRPSAWRPSKRSYAPDEVEALLASARLEAREAALAEAASIRDLALGEIGQALGHAMPTLAAVAQAHRRDAADLAISAARVVAASALERLPQAPLRAALEQLGQEIDASPRLVLRTGALDDEGRAVIERLAADAGFTGQVAFREDAAMPAAAFCLEWADGRATFDADEAMARIAAALNAALAAEGGHGDPLTPDNGAL